MKSYHTYILFVIKEVMMYSEAKITEDLFLKKCAPKINLNKTILAQKYTIFKELDKGTNSIVYVGLNRSNKKQYVIKFYDLSLISDKKIAQQLRVDIYSRVKFMKNVHNTNILTCFQLFANDQYIALVTQYCYDGTLQEYIHSQNITADKGINILEQITNSIKSIQDQGYTISSLNPQKIFIKNGTFILADFSFLSTNKPKNIFTAPQLKLQSVKQTKRSQEIDHLHKSDVWAISMLYLYMLIADSSKLERQMHKLAEMNWTQNPTFFSYELENCITNKILNKGQRFLLKQGLKFKQNQRLSWNQLINKNNIFINLPSLEDNQTKSFKCSNLETLQRTSVSYSESQQQQLLIQSFGYTALCSSDIYIQCQDINNDEKQLYDKLQTLYYLSQKVEYLLNNIICAIQLYDTVNMQCRVNVQLMFLVCSRCFIDISKIKQTYNKQNISEHSTIKQYQNKINKLYQQITKKFKKYSQLLTLQQSKKLEMLKDRFYESNQKRKKKDKYLGGVQSIDFTRQEQIIYTEQQYIKPLIKKLREKKKSMKKLENYNRIIDVFMIYKKICMGGNRTRINDYLREIVDEREKEMKMVLA